MGKVEIMEKYREERQADKGKIWANTVIHSWNTVKEKGKTRLTGEELEFLVGELDQINDAFTTHFKDGSYFMTTTESWTSMWEQYVDVVEGYANNLAQRADLMEERVKTAELMIGKLQFIFTDVNEATMMPPLPLMTRGVLTGMI